MSAFELVVLVVCVGSCIVSLAAFVHAGRLYDQIGQPKSPRMATEHELSGEAKELVREEVRQILAGVGSTPQRRGQTPAGSSHEHA